MTDSGSTIGTIVSTGGFSSSYPYGSIDISTHNLLPLEAWRAEMSYHPWHFWQLSDTNFTPVSSACPSVVKQYAWQGTDHVGRSEIIDAIVSAEEKMRNALGYSVAPHYVEETIPWPHFYDQRFDKSGYSGADGKWITVRLGENKINAIGVEARTLLDTPLVVYSDSDSDGLNDTFTLTVATTVTDPEEIAVYFGVADRLDGEIVSEKWRVAPVKVKIASGIATIKGRSWLLVKPVLYEGVTGESINPTIVTNFVTNLEVYRRYASSGTTNDSCQALLVWETRPLPIWYTNNPITSTDPAGVAYAQARVSLRNAELGTVGIGEAIYDPVTQTWAQACNLTWWRPPDKVIVRYNAGYPSENGTVSKKFLAPLARMAAAEVARPICACETANRILYNWQFDLSRAAGANDEQYSTVEAMLSNPFGTRRGHWEGWSAVTQNRILRGFSV